MAEETEQKIPLSQTEDLEEVLNQIPARPGVYLMKDHQEKVIYIGKAANLRTRVRSYYREAGDSRFSIQFLRRRVTTIDTIITDSEKEALLLENTLIKKHKPRYNIRLRDDKTYISLRLDVSHEWPRVHRFRRPKTGDKALYFGPYSSSSAVNETIRFVQKLFPLRSCPDSVLYNRARPCILHQIERCSAPCVGLVDHEQYNDYVEQTIMFLKGKKEDVIQLLRDRMEQYSEELAFEKAAMIRDRLRAIEKTIEREKVAGHRRFERDVVALARDQGRMLLTVLQYRKGILSGTRHFDFRDHGQQESEVMGSFLSQFYLTSSDIPRDILVSITPIDHESLQATLQELRESRVRLISPQRGDKRRLIEMAETNAKLELEKRLAGIKSRDVVIKDLQQKLKLPTEPRRIECFDISNIQGTFVVGSMTSMIDGEPDKSSYRRFKIRTVEGQDDFASMREVLTRRYSRVIREKGELPDLIVIDGGKGQLGIAVEVLKELKLLGNVPVCGLAKARPQTPRRTNSTQGNLITEERVFTPNRKLPIRFDQSDPALFLLTRIRDEAHRFGVSYHRKLRSASSLKSGLEEIPGVGAKRRNVLLSHFGSLTRLKKASLEDIINTPGIPETTAKEIYSFLHSTS